MCVDLKTCPRVLPPHFCALAPHLLAAANWGIYAKTGLITRVGARAGRLVRVLRIVRLTRIVKIFKAFKQMQQRKKTKRIASNKVHVVSSPANLSSSFDAGNRGDSQRVGAQYSGATTRKVLILFLVLLIGLQLLTAEYPVNEAEVKATNTLHQYVIESLVNPNVTNRSLHVMIDSIVRRSSFKVIEIVLNHTAGANRVYLWPEAERENLRAEERLILSVPGDPKSSYVATIARFNTRAAIVETAIADTIITFSLMVLLLVFTGLFIWIADKLVLRPIEAMVQVVHQISENPLQEHFETDTSLFKRGMETTMLLHTITKIAGLLRLGFGSAGADIISKNLSGANALNTAQAGTIVQGIFAFCDIRDFTVTSECLLEEIVPFVNRIACIIHDTAHDFGGEANKNVGDAFLLVWKFGKSDFSTADVTVFTMMKVTSVIATEQNILDCITPEGRRAIHRRLPDFRVRIGIGMHVGWAIEGAIGSKRKIDPTYLSPHVNLCMKLEEMTKAYRTHIVISGTLFEMCSHRCQQYCRQVDRVQLGTAAVHNKTQWTDLYSPKTTTHLLDKVVVRPVEDLETPAESPPTDVVAAARSAAERLATSLATSQPQPSLAVSKLRAPQNAASFRNANKSPQNAKMLVHTLVTDIKNEGKSEGPGSNVLMSGVSAASPPSPSHVSSERGSTEYDSGDDDDFGNGTFSPDRWFDKDIVKLRDGFDSGFNVAYSKAIGMYLNGDMRQAHDTFDIASAIFEAATGVQDGGKLRILQEYAAADAVAVAVAVRMVSFVVCFVSRHCTTLYPSIAANLI